MFDFDMKPFLNWGAFLHPRARRQISRDGQRGPLV